MKPARRLTHFVNQSLTGCHRFAGTWNRKLQSRRWETAAAFLLFLPALACADDRSGAVIYHEMCASCHGANGEGQTSGYANPLIGDRSIGELSKYIDQTMPEGEPEKLDAAGAGKVAAYIHEAFYSPTAQARNQPARVELSRLTVRQYRLVVADLIESFRWSGRLTDQQGLKAEYYQSRRARKEDRKVERVDPEVRFQFGEAAPVEGQLEPKEYFIRWIGGLYAPVTGEYEFVIRSENGVRLWINEQWGKAVLDAGVKSGTDTEFRASMFLVAGRVYPMRLELNKSDKEKSGSIEFLWKPPQLGLQTVPSYCLTPEGFAESCIVSTPFPPDDRSVGYERGTTISKAWDEATTDAALQVAAYVVAKLDNLAKTKSDDKDRRQKIETFCREFTERAFRRPLTPDEVQFFVQDQLSNTPSLEAGVQRCVLLTLKSPYFLYHELGGGNDPFHVAARLSFALWDSLPDRDLWEAARRDQLKTPADLRRHAERMSRNLRAQAKLDEFLHLWVKADQLHDLAKDTKLFPEFGDTLQTDLRTSLDLTLNALVRSEAVDFRELLSSRHLMLNGRLARFYGVDLPLEAGFQPVEFPSEQRAGLLTHPFLLAGFSYHAISSPIHRGVWIARSLLGRTLRTPPVAVAPLAPDLHADLTTRDRVTLQTSPALCQSCHTLINPLGFALEHFDAVGRYRESEKNKPIDAQGVYITRAGREIPFRGARQLADFLVSDPETHATITEQLFQYLAKQPILAFGADVRAQLTQQFQEQGFNLRKLQADIAVAAAFLPTPATTAAKP